MSGSINKVILVGNVGNEPEIKVTQSSGDELATFSLATSEKWRDKATGESREKTDWHRIVVFSPGLVKIVKNYVQRGSKLYIEGKMQTEEYQDSSGVKRYITKVILANYASAIALLDSKKNTSENSFDINNSNNSTQVTSSVRSQDSNQAINDKDDYNNLEELDDKIPF